MAGSALTAERSEPRFRLPGRPVPAAFFARDTRMVARELLGLLLCRREADGTYTVGRILETEAYIGEDDPACHAAAGLTPRTKVMYGPPGVAYVYFTYGMHYCLNVVTERRGFPAAVLLRALRPEAGLDRMRKRRGRIDPLELTSGPARLCQALGVDLAQNGTSLRGPVLVLRDDGAPAARLASGPRIGVRVGTDRSWRYWVDGDPHVSRPRPRPRGRPRAPVPADAG